MLVPSLTLHGHDGVWTFAFCRLFEQMASPYIKSLPIFWGHGKRDPLVKYPLGVRSVEFLKSQLGVLPAASDSPQAGGICFNSYDGLPHSTNNEELRDLLAWLKKVLPGE